MDDQTPEAYASLGAERARALVVRARVRPPATSGYLIAEGDCWLDDPGYQDIVDALERRHGFRVECAARHGETAEEVASDDRQLDRFRRVFERLASGNDAAGSRTPRAILLSCGGNDVAHTFSTLIQHVDAGLPVLDEEMMRGLVAVRVRAAISSLIGSAMTFSTAYFGRTIPIFIHGNARPVPERRRYKRGGIRSSGPWLKPGFPLARPPSADRQPNGELRRNAEEIARVIDLFNDHVLASLPSAPPFVGVVQYVPLRPAPDMAAGIGNGTANGPDPAAQAHDPMRAARAIVAAIQATD